MHHLDPSVLPTATGRIAQFTLNPRGDVDGVLLDDDRQIHVPPHLGTSLEKLVKLGDTIEARYVKPRNGDVFAAVSVSNAAGKTVLDDGPPHKRGKDDRRDDQRDNKQDGKRAPKLEYQELAKTPVHLEGRVRVTLFAPKGEVCGAVLESGEQVRIDPKANAELAPYFAKDTQVQVWGAAFKRKGVTVVDAHEIAFSKDVA